jgi:peptidase M28-like protein
VIDLRLWRIALLSVPIAVMVGMFSLQDVPPPLEPAIPPDAFETAAADSLARELSESTSEPRPGSEADNALAELVAARFTAIQGATVSEQRFEGSFGGEDVELRNLIAVLPGESDRQIALIASRDARDGTGATTSIASTAALLEIASSFSGTTHNKTLVFVSTDGDSIGALGARRFVNDYTGAGLIDAAVVLSQPASADPTEPLVIPWSSGPQSTATQLEETASRRVSEEVGVPAGDEGPLDDLFRLAVPAGLGDQGPLIESGLDAVRLSSSGELPSDPEGDEIDNLNGETLGGFGRAALSIVLALDARPEPVSHGPAAYIGLAGNLLPGWAIGLVAVVLLGCVAVSAFAGLASSARSPGEAARGLIWAAAASLPFVAALLVIYLTALVGFLASPEFPFDPGSERLGVGGAISAVAALLALAGIAYLLRPLRRAPPRAAAAAAPAAVSLAVIAGFGIWLSNPYLGLLVALGLQAWLLAARPGSRRGGALTLVLIGLVPVLAGVADLAGRFETGFGIWRDLLFMFTGGQIGGLLGLLWCVLAGTGAAIVALSHGPTAPPAPEMQVRAARGDGELSGDDVEGGAGPPAPERAGFGTPPAPEEAPQPESGSADPELEPEPQPGEEPERDPRLWSKPRGSTSLPSPRRSVTPPPSPA